MKEEEKDVDLYDGSELFESVDQVETDEAVPSELIDEVEKIIYPQSKAFGDQDGNSKRP